MATEERRASVVPMSFSTRVALMTSFLFYAACTNDDQAPPSTAEDDRDSHSSGDATATPSGGASGAPSDDEDKTLSHAGGAGAGRDSKSSETSTGGAPAVSGQPGIEVLGGSCASPGLLACQGNNPYLTLICGSSQVWEAGEVCADGRVCSPAATSRGTCLQRHPTCIDQETDVPFCTEGDSATCDARGLELTQTECPSGCVDGACTPVDDECLQGEQLADLTDCSGTCKTIDYGCSSYSPANLYTLTGLLRLPSASTLVPVEGASCENVGVFASIYPTANMRILLPRDWRMRFEKGSLGTSLTPETDELLCRDDELRGCVSIAADASDLRTLFFTPLNAEAAERNIVIEQSNDALPCD